MPGSRAFTDQLQGLRVTSTSRPHTARSALGDHFMSDRNVLRLKFQLINISFTPMVVLSDSQTPSVLWGSNAIKAENILLESLDSINRDSGLIFT